MTGVIIVMLSVLLLPGFVAVAIMGGRAHDRANEEAARKKRDGAPM